jgi:hypothetical protein
VMLGRSIQIHILGIITWVAFLFNLTLVIKQIYVWVCGQTGATGGARPRAPPVATPLYI